MFCSKCGNKIEDGAKFCDSCGNAVAVERLGTNASATVARKNNKKLPVILGICVVVIILIAISISVLGKKADKVARIVNAYENTINAENFDIYLGVAERHWCMEVFGKESFEDTYIATFFNNDLGYKSDNWLKYIDEDDLYRLIHDEYYIDKGRDTLKNNASDWFAYDEYEMIAKRDFGALWNHEFSDEIGLTYDEAYDLATSIVLNYLKNKNDSAVESIEIEDNKYSIRCGVDNFAEDSEYEDTVNEFIDYVEDAYIYAYDCDEGCKLEEIYFEVKLEGKYIKSLSIYLTFDTEINGKDEIPFFILQFANVNELTKETSLAYKLYNELSEGAYAEEAVAKETEDMSVVESEFSTEVEVKFNCFAYWIDNINYSHNVLNLYQNPGEGNAQFNLSYDIDENCKWMKATEEGEEDWGIEGNDIAAQKLVDVVTYSNAMYEKCIQAGNADYADKNYPYRSEVCYNLILKGYSTSENSATITEVLLLHNDVRFDYGDDNQYRAGY